MTEEAFFHTSLFVHIPMCLNRPSLLHTGFNAASLFRLRYANPEAINDLELALEAAFQSAEGIIIEVNTNRDDNLEEVRRLCRNLSERIQSAAN